MKSYVYHQTFGSPKAGAPQETKTPESVQPDKSLETPNEPGPVELSQPVTQEPPVTVPTTQTEQIPESLETAPIIQIVKIGPQKSDGKIGDEIVADTTQTAQITDPVDKKLTDFKFTAFLIAESTWKILAGLVLFWGKDMVPDQFLFVLLAIIFVAGFVETGFILGQASLDKFIHLAKISADLAGARLGLKISPSDDGKNSDSSR